MTALIRALDSRKEAVALLLMEATQKAGALDVQVNVVWSVGRGGEVVGAGAGKGGEDGGGGGHLPGTDSCVYVPAYTLERKPEL